MSTSRTFTKLQDKNRRSQIPRGVQLSEGEQIYHWFSWLCTNLEPAVQPAPEDNVLGVGIKQASKEEGKFPKKSKKKMRLTRHLWGDAGAKYFHTAGVIIPDNNLVNLQFCNLLSFPQLCKSK